VPALLFGVAFGNLFLGLPFHYDELQRPVFTGSFFGLLHPFALLTGIVSLAMLIMHGTAYAALKVGEPMSRRAAAVGRSAAVVFILAFIIAGVWVDRLEGARIVAGADPFGPSNPLDKQVVLSPGAWLANYRDHALLWLLPVLGVAGAGTSWLWLGAQRAGSAFLASSVSVAATILTAGVGLFPFLMPSSTHPSHGLTIWDASSSAYTLGVMLVAVVVLLPLILAYTAWVFRVMRGRITLEEIRRHTGIY
jgi:cytochrome bd ubiquinol oxidase subunit II